MHRPYERHAHVINVLQSAEVSLFRWYCKLLQQLLLLLTSLGASIGQSELITTTTTADAATTTTSLLFAFSTRCIRTSVYLSEMGVHCDHTMHFSTDFLTTEHQVTIFWIELDVLRMIWQFWTRSLAIFLVRDVFVRLNCRAVAMMFVCLSEPGVHCDYTVHFSADLNS